MSGKTKKKAAYNRRNSGIEDILKIVNNLERLENRRENYLKKLNTLTEEDLKEYLYDLKEITNLNLDLLQETLNRYNLAKKEIKEVEKILENY